LEFKAGDGVQNLKMFRSRSIFSQGRNQLFISGGKFSWNFIQWRYCAD